ncbi:MAG: ATP-binding cassette domain-containing protein, partial [Opitutae bacterium]|nr:ATP-binding cassette domain-containing protein [Opitutae bacterium]
MAGIPPPLEIHDLTVSYDRKPVLYGVDAVVETGSLVGVVGPNGAGKSTLIKTIMGIVQPNGGWVKIFGQPYKKAVTRVGYVPQRESVDWDFPVSVMDVVLMGRYGHA